MGLPAAFTVPVYITVNPVQPFFDFLKGLYDIFPDMIKYTILAVIALFVLVAVMAKVTR